MCLVCCGLGIHIDDMMLHALSPTSMGKAVPLGDALTLVIKIKVIQFERR